MGNLAARLLVALAAFAAVRSHATFQVDTAALHEGRFLATLVGAALATAAVLGRGQERFLILATWVVTTAAWVLPAGPTRGAGLSLLLLVTLLITAGRRLQRDGGDPTFALLAPLAFGLQLLCRSDRLLTPAPADLVTFGVLPLAAALGTALLVRHFGPPALLAAAAVLTLGGGWTTVGALTLLALGAGRQAARGNRVPALLLAVLWVAAGIVSAVGWPLLLPVLAMLWRLPSEPRRLGPIWGTALLAAVALALELGSGAPAASLAELPGALGWLLLLLPAAPLALPVDRWRELLPVAALALLLARWSPDPALLALPAALAAVIAFSDRTAPPLQLAWSLATTVATVLLAAYPWLRPQPAAEAFALVGTAPDSWTVVLVALLFLLADGPLSRRWVPAATVTGALVVALALAATGQDSGENVPLPGEAVTLHAKRPRFTARPRGDGGPWLDVTRVVVDSHLANSAELRPGTPVAQLRLRPNRGPVQRWTLHAGQESGEWAARRADVAAVPFFQAPAPWTTSVAAEGGFFAQRYRTHYRRPRPGAIREIEVELAPDLPQDVSLTLWRLELRR